MWHKGVTVVMQGGNTVVTQRGNTVVTQGGNTVVAQGSNTVVMQGGNTVTQDVNTCNQILFYMAAQKTPHIYGGCIGAGWIVLIAYHKR